MTAIMYEHKPDHWLDISHPSSIYREGKHTVMRVGEQRLVLEKPLEEVLSWYAQASPSQAAQEVPRKRRTKKTEGEGQ